MTDTQDREALQRLVKWADPPNGMMYNDPTPMRRDKLIAALAREKLAALDAPALDEQAVRDRLEEYGPDIDIFDVLEALRDLGAFGSAVTEPRQADKDGSDRDESARDVKRPQTSAGAPDEQTYPCDDCGKLRTAAQGGTTFTVCERCFAKRHPPDVGTDEHPAIKAILDIRLGMDEENQEVWVYRRAPALVEVRKLVEWQRKVRAAWMKVGSLAWFGYGVNPRYVPGAEPVLRELDALLTEDTHE